MSSCLTVHRYCLPHLSLIPIPFCVLCTLLLTLRAPAVALVDTHSVNLLTLPFLFYFAAQPVTGATSAIIFLFLYSLCPILKYLCCSTAIHEMYKNPLIWPRERQATLGPISPLLLHALYLFIQLSDSNLSPCTVMLVLPVL